MAVVRHRLQQNFGAAAAQYDARAEFQHQQTRRVLDAALMLLPTRGIVADIGCGTGVFAQTAAPQRPQWRVLGVDIAYGMCAMAQARCTTLNADAAQLPLANASVDGAVSALCYQWVENQHDAFIALARVLKAGGRAIIASLGADSLRELRHSADAAQLPLHLLPMQQFETTRDALRGAGFGIVMAEQRMEVRYYDHVPALLDSMRAIGAGNNFINRQKGMGSPKRWASMLSHYEAMRGPKGIPATWEHHFFVLEKTR